MRLLRRYLTFSVLAFTFSFLATLYIVRQWPKNKSHYSHTSVQGILKFNSDPKAVFYNSVLSPFNTRLERVGLQKLDAAFVKSFLQQKDVIDLYREHSINVALSDVVPVNRLIPDSRPEGCGKITYPNDLPMTSIVIPFFNEWPSILLRTVHSIINRTPKNLLKEIILVDDASDLTNVLDDLDEQLTTHFPDGKVKLLRLPKRVGLIRARMHGLKFVTAEVVSFFDSHMEVNVGWLQPLLAEVKKNRTTVAMAQLDYINRGNLQYEYTEGYRTRYGFQWSLAFFETYFRADQLEEKSDTDPLPGVIMVGPAFVVDVEYFKHLGMYDEQMKIWGGENIEFPWRVWMCGGRLIHVPCSRIGHIARSQPYPFPDGRSETELHNYKRAVEVWMGEYKEYAYEANPEMKKIDIGDVSDRIAIRDKLQCKPFKWFLENIWPDLLPYKHNSKAWGSVSSAGDMCLDNEDYLFSLNQRLRPNTCSDQITKQTFALTSTSELKTQLQCVVVTGSYIGEKYPSLQGCFEGPPEKWEHRKGGYLKHVSTGLCLQLEKGRSLIMTICDKSNHRQQWKFQHYTM